MQNWLRQTCNVFVFTFIKVVFAAFLLLCFSGLRESTCETWKTFFISLQMLASFSKKSNFRTWDILISWRRQMLKYRIRATFYWITWDLGRKHSLLMKFGQFMSYCERKKLLKNSKKTLTWKLVSPLFYLQRIKQKLYWKMKFLMEATHIRYVVDASRKSDKLRSFNMNN